MSCNELLDSCRLFPERYSDVPRQFVLEGLKRDDDMEWEQIPENLKSDNEIAKEAFAKDNAATGTAKKR